MSLRPKLAVGEWEGDVEVSRVLSYPSGVTGFRPSSDLLYLISGLRRPRA